MPTESRKAHFIYEGDRTRHLVFPLGGVGSGGFAISGSGRLVDWSIRDRPALQTSNGLSHFALKAEREGEIVDARVLHGPYDGAPEGAPMQRRFFDGWGFGANRNSLAGMPHFSATRVTGPFPILQLDFLHETFPARVAMTAFSPFIPHEDRDSAMPVGMFEISVENTTDGVLDYTLGAVLANHECESGDHAFLQQDGMSLLHLRQPGQPDLRRGCLSLATDADDVTAMEYLYRGQWFDDLGVYWRDFTAPGGLKPRRYDHPRRAPHMFGQPDHGALAARFSLAPGARRNLRFVIAFHFPDNEVYWFDRVAKFSGIEGPAPRWRNYYATQWADSAAVAREALQRWDGLHDATAQFRDAVMNSTTPVEIVDASLSNMALLRTQTVMRLDDGTLWAWEGQFADEGSCEGSCTHVWNYQQTLPFIFPALERSLRDNEFTYNQQENGGLTFRQRLPQHPLLDWNGPCADGHFGAIIKTYRDWKLGGDTEWLRGHWPALKRAIEYAWSPDNPDQWDPEQTGLLTGKQHHTLDMELFGPNAWLSGFYVVALYAAAAMAEALDETAFAVICRAIADKGARAIDNRLFNGEYYVQSTDLTDKSIVDRFAASARAGVIEDEDFLNAYWSDENGQIKYQFGDGCHSDQLLALWHAELAGLACPLDRAQTDSALLAIYRHNFHSELHDHFNPNRVYAYEDEAGLTIASWPEVCNKPVVPAPYSEEIWTGIEYMVASHLILRGYRDEGLRLIRAVRQRHDGRRRNPWNEMECGSYYARSMSAFATLLAWTGVQSDMVNGSLSFRFDDTPTRSFWATGTAWGSIEVSAEQGCLEVLHGTLAINTLTLRGPSGRRNLDVPKTLIAGERWSF